MDPNNLTVKDILLAASPTVALIVGIVFLVQGQTWYAAIVLVPLAIFFIYSFAKMPWEEIGEQEVERREKLLETKTGKLRYVFTKLIDYVSIIGLAFFVLTIMAGIYIKVFSNGS
jgi:hypothetical protein